MAIGGQIHWYEGLFLQPHHLQTMQRQQLGQVASERQLDWSYPYGVIDASLSADAMENLLVQYNRLRVIMPSGLEVSVPDNADLPALNIKQTFEASTGAFTVYLGVPLWYPSRGNTIQRGETDDWRVKRIYRTTEIGRPDENTGENPQPILVRRINARLLLGSDDQSDMEVLPILRIAHAAGEDVGLPRQDPGYIPACLVVNGSPVLRDMLRDLANQVDASRKELVLQLTRAGFSIDNLRGVQLEQLLRLRTLASFGGILVNLVAAPMVSPFRMYLTLRDLLGQLAGLHPDRDLFDVPDYDHDDLAVSFGQVVERIRALLRGAVAPSFLQVPFQREGRLFVATLTDDHLTRPNEYFLGVQTREDPRGLAVLVEDADKFKLMAKSLANQRIWGIKLAEERHPPLELPSQVGLHYFRLMRADSARMWSRIQQEKVVAVRWPDLESSDYKLTLYMTVPGEGN